MTNEYTNALIIELATWNGRLAAAIEIALVDFQHNNPESGLKTLRRTYAAYEAYREQESNKQTKVETAR